MNYSNKFQEFLNNMKNQNPPLIEVIQKGFSLLFETTEEVVEKVKEKVGSKKEDWGSLISDDEENEENEWLNELAETASKEASEELDIENFK